MNAPKGFHRVRWLAVAVWIVAFTALTAYGLRQGQLAHTGICALRSDVQSRYHQNNRLLLDHPKGDPIRAYGLTIPRATIVASVKSQKSTLDALKSAGCE